MPLKNLPIASERMLEILLSNPDHGVLWFIPTFENGEEAPDFWIEYVNPTGAGLLGFQADEMLGQALSKLYEDACGEALQKILQQAQETDEIVRQEGALYHEDVPRWYKFSVYPESEGLLVSFQDITDWKESARLSEARERRYYMLFQESIDAIFLADEQFELLEVNVAFTDLAGELEAELKGRFLATFLSSADWERWMAVVRQELEPEGHEYTFRTVGGIKRTVLMSCVKTPREDETGYLYIGVIKDVTRSRLIERKGILAEKLLMTGRLTRSIAHEVRNPLTNLTLAIEQLKDEVEGQVEDADLYLNILSRNVERIGQLIDNLLDSSKPRNLDCQPCTLDEVIVEVEKLVKDRLELKEMTLSVRLSEPAPQLRLDKEQLTLALVNLCINAIEAMPEGEGKLELITGTDKEWAWLDVKDNGKGIPKEYQKQLFDPFFSQKQGGNGLGLTATQNIVHGHGGRIEVESEPGKGTLFTLYFPF